MFEELVKQAKRIFSSKSNAGKLVRCQTDRLHLYKQVLLALSIVLLLGYSQFRQHFRCEPVGSVDSETVTNFCWVNGTKTVNLRNAPDKQIQLTGRGQQQWNGSSFRQRSNQLTSDSPSLVEKIIPHVGLQFRWTDRKYEVINHNYMRSLWALLILMACCSYAGQRAWSSLFNNDILKALLKLPNHENLIMVQSGQRAKAFEVFMRLPAARRQQPAREQPACELVLVELFEKHNLFDSINLISGENEYNHLLDYYPNQLIYLLLANTSSTPNNKLKKLRLKYKLASYQFLSTCLTSLQFFLPLLAIGPEYKLYGWHYLQAWLSYTSQLSYSSHPAEATNSIDYELSARIWPTVTQCIYRGYGLSDLDSLPSRCFVAINEICGKLFVAIWWFVAVNMLLEFYQLLVSLVNLFAFRSFLLRFQLSSECRRALREIAGFRKRHSRLLERILRAERGSSPPGNFSSVKGSGGLKAEKAREEAGWQEEGQVGKSRSTFKDEEDEDIYFYFQLLYLRLDCSRRQTGEVVMMTNDALNRYLENLSSFEASKAKKPLE